MHTIEEIDKNTLPIEIRNLSEDLKYDNFYITLKGSSKYKFNNYITDYDFVTKITNKGTPEQIYDEMTSIIGRLSENPNFWMIELKLQDYNNNKIKLFPNDSLKLNDIKIIYPELSFIKIDGIVYYDGQFYEVSMNYNFPDYYKHRSDPLKEIKEDINELLDEGQYYKALKRKFSYLVATNQIDEAEKLIPVFNSEIGAYYSTKSRIDSIIKLWKDYKSNDVKKKILFSLYSLGYDNPSVKDIKGLNRVSKELEEKINSLAKPINKVI